MSNARRIAAGAGSAVAAIVIATLVIFASAVLHLSSAIGRVAAAELTEDAIDSQIRGSLRIGAITQLDFDGVKMRDVRVISPAGHAVATIDAMQAGFSFRESLRRGALLLTPCEMTGGTMRLTHGPSDQIALVDAFEPRRSDYAVPVLLKHIRLSHQTILLTLPGMPLDIEMDDVAGGLELALDQHFVAHLSRLHGVVSFPIARLPFERLSGRLRGGDARPLAVRMVLELVVADPSMAITYLAPGAVGRAGDPGMGIELGVDVPDDTHVATHRDSPLHAAGDRLAH